MHGLIFAELKKYVDGKLGGEAWRNLLRDAGLGARVYMPTQTYPDTEVAALVGAASRTANLAPGAILEDFGTFIVADLVAVYGAYIRPEWRTLDLILNTEETIHRVVRTRNPGAAPPELKVKRLAPDEVEIEYSSQRKLCAIARGIVRGVAAHYAETVAVAEPQCMHRGDPKCLLRVRVSR